MLKKDTFWNNAQLKNDGLDDSAWHYWAEKRLNEIALNSLAGTPPDSLAEADIHTIAQTCLDEGGRAVLSARGLSEVWFRTHYDDDGCQPAAARSLTRNQPESRLLSPEVVPNPADAEVTVRLEKTEKETGPAAVQVVSLTGAVVYSGTLAPDAGELRISVADWPNGMYLVRISAGGAQYKATFIVQH